MTSSLETKTELEYLVEIEAAMKLLMKNTDDSKKRKKKTLTEEIK